MNRIIPRDLIRHLEWSPDKQKQEPPKPLKVKSDPKNTSSFNVDDVLRGTTFYSNDSSKGVAIALKQALDYATSDGIVATMPELIAAKIKAEKTHDFWNKWYTVHTEENIGLDKSGKFYSTGEPVLVIVNGGGILTPERIMQAYADGLVENSARYTESEWENLLDGKLSDGGLIDLIKFDDLKNTSNLPRRFGVVIPYSTAQNTSSDYHEKKEFLENPLIIARNGGLNNLEEYFDKAKTLSNQVGNWHPFSGRDPSQPQGRLLFLNGYFNGLGGDNSLSGNGRFVGVAPEAPDAKK